MLYLELSTLMKHENDQGKSIVFCWFQGKKNKERKENRYTESHANVVGQFTQKIVASITLC